jgi:hypothetical protein
MSITGARGEVTIQRNDGGDVRVLYTNRALANAEKMMRKSIVEVARGFAEGQSGISDIAYVLLAGMEAARVDARIGGKQYSMNDAFDVLDEVGFAGVAGPVMEAVSEVLSYSGAVPADPNV